jgi:hypothetical protein
MNDYLIGGGAVLTAGPAATIAAATLHAETEPGLAQTVEAAVVDFEGSSPSELSRIVILAAGWPSARFEREVTAPLLGRHECNLGDVVEALARAAGVREVHLFARWLPDSQLSTDLARRSIRLVAHPLQAIGQAALVSGQRVSRWRSPIRAA